MKKPTQNSTNNSKPTSQLNNTSKINPLSHPKQRHLTSSANISQYLTPQTIFFATPEETHVRSSQTKSTPSQPAPHIKQILCQNPTPPPQKKKSIQKHISKSVTTQHLTQLHVSSTFFLCQFPNRVCNTNPPFFH